MYVLLCFMVLYWENSPSEDICQIQMQLSYLVIITFTTGNRELSLEQRSSPLLVCIVLEGASLSLRGEMQSNF